MLEIISNNEHATGETVDVQSSSKGKIMRNLVQRGENRDVIAWAINYLTDGDTERYLKIIGLVTATVKNIIVIDEELIQLDFTNPPHGPSSVNIYWEESGYKAYKNLGLFGQMTSEWQTFIRDDNNNIYVKDKTYEIKIELDKTNKIFSI